MGEFNRLVAEAKEAGKEMTKEMEKQIWQEAIANVKAMQEEQIGNQTEDQDPKFLQQLIQELHDVCDMFGHIDSSKVTTKNINGVEVQIYEADWDQGEKVQW